HVPDVIRAELVHAEGGVYRQLLATGAENHVLGVLEADHRLRRAGDAVVGKSGPPRVWRTSVERSAHDHHRHGYLGQAGPTELEAFARHRHDGVNAIIAGRRPQTLRYFVEAGQCGHVRHVREG